MRFFFLTAFLLLGLTISFGQTSVQVIAEKADVRSSPNARAAIITTVPRGEKFEVIERSGEWTKVKTPGNVGWILGSAVRNVYPLIESILDAERDPRPRLDNRSAGPGTGTGRGQGSGTGTGTGQASSSSPDAGTGSDAVRKAGTAPLRLLFKPKASYTEVARTNNVQGTVRLKVTFLSSGQIGRIVPITSLPDGLTDQAMAAARQIRFEPKRVNGVPKTTVLLVDYTFNVY